MGIVHIAVHLLRIASEALFLFELNKVLGALVHGGSRARKVAANHAESDLLSHARTTVSKIQVLLPDHTSLHTLVAGSSSGPIVVLLHGHSMCAALFYQQIDSLAMLGNSVFAPDLPGWGRSSRPLFLGGTACAGVDYYATRVLAWMDALNLHRVALVGHSLGAYLAHEVARRRPHIVRGMALAAPAAIARNISYPCAFWFRFTPQRFMSQGGLLAAAVFNCFYPPDNCYAAKGVREMLLCDNSFADGSGDAAAAALLRISHATFEAQCERPLLELVEYFPFPVQLVVGDRDALVKTENVHELCRRMAQAGNKVSMCVIPNADHSPHISTPDLFAAVIKTVVQTGVVTAVKA